MKDNKEVRDRTIFAMWLACATQDEIAEKCDVTQKTIDNWIQEFSKNPDAGELLNFNDFTPPIYNIWKQQAKSEGSSLFRRRWRATPRG